MRVLYVEDNVADADLTRRALKRHAPGYSLEVVETLRDALARLGDGGHHDVVLADLRLPDGSGLELLTTIRERGLPIAVVILTGSGDEDSAITAIRSGADDYLVKSPDYANRLPSVIASAVKRSREQASMRAQPIRVLYAEHNPADRDLTLRYMARHAPYIRVTVIEHSADVLARLPVVAAGPLPYDVLLLDYRLPGVDALEVIRTLRLERRLDIPVVLVTGQGSEEVAIAAMHLGVDEYLPKRGDYLQALAAILEKAHRRALLMRDRAELRTTTERLRHLLSASPIVLVAAIVDGPNLVPTWVSDSVGRVWGYTVAEALRPGWWPAVVHPDDRRDAASAVSALLAEGSAMRELRCLHRGGKVFWVQLVIQLEAESAESAGEGAPRRAIGALVDITKSRIEQQRLRESERRFRTVFDQAAVGVAQIDSRTDRFISVNEKCCAIIGFSEAELLAKTSAELVHEEDRDPYVRQMQRLLVGEIRSTTIDQRLVHKDGSSVWVSLTVSPMWAKSEEPTLHIAILEDITTRKEAQEALSRSQQQLLLAQKLEAVARLAGGIAHDFNNILTAVLSYANMVADALDPSDPMRADVQEIVKAGERGAVMTRQLLAFSRRRPTELKVINLNRILSGMEPMLRRLIGEHVDLRIQLAEEGAYVLADASQMEQVIMNLLVNARDAMPNGGLLVVQTANVELEAGHCSRQAEIRPGGYVRLTVVDTGCGMDAPTKARVFEPFFTTKAPGQGTGLGLATTYGIVRQSGGHINVESEVGHGTTFEVFLPRTAQPADDATQSLRSIMPARAHETVLVVEDEDSVRAATCRILRHAGYTVLSAPNGAKALDVSDRHDGPIALLITDVVMPGITGAHLAMAIAERRPDIRVLFVSGYNENAQLQQERMPRSYESLGKPFTPAQITWKVRDMIDSTVPKRVESLEPPSSSKPGRFSDNTD